MNKQEFVGVINIINVLFPQMKINTTDGDVMNVWYEVLGDLDSNFAKAAIKKMSQTEKGWPTVERIRYHYNELVNGRAIDAGEAFDMVWKMVRTKGRYRAEEVQKEVPPLVWLAIERLGGWSTICDTDVETGTGVIRGQFNKVLDTLTQRQKEQQQTSLDLSQMIQIANERNGVPQLDFTPKPVKNLLQIEIGGKVGQGDKAAAKEAISNIREILEKMQKKDDTQEDTAIL